MIAVYVFLFLFALISGFLLFIFSVTELYDEYIIRIEEADISIKQALNKKLDLLKKANDTIKSITNSDEDKLKNIEQINIEELNNIEIDNELELATKEFNKFGEDDLSIKNNKDYIIIEEELVKFEAEVIALKKYYNDVADKYNKMTSFLPYKIVAKIKNYDTLETFNNDNYLELVEN